MESSRTVKIFEYLHLYTHRNYLDVNSAEFLGKMFENGIWLLRPLLSRQDTYKRQFLFRHCRPPPRTCLSPTNTFACAMRGFKTRMQNFLMLRQTLLHAPPNQFFVAIEWPSSAGGCITILTIPT
jgi:hypothetical protein